MSSVTFECPGCGARIVLSASVRLPIDDFGAVGCLNEDEHDDDDALVMHKVMNDD